MMFHPESKHVDINNFFKEHGYAVIERFYASDECDQLIERMKGIVDKQSQDNLGVFYTIHDEEHNKNKHLFDSGDKISLFLEKGFDAKTSRNNLFHKLNKVGHALHDIDPIFSQFSRKPALAKLSKALGIKKPLLVQSMFIFKSPKVGGEVVPHQDGSFLYTEPESVIGFWVALEDATIKNGCLMISDKGHFSPLRQRFRKVNNESVMEQTCNEEFPEVDLALEVKKGSLVLLHGRLPHRSCANMSEKSRYAYAVHVIDGHCHYLDDNWLTRPTSMPFVGF